MRDRDRSRKRKIERKIGCHQLYLHMVKFVHSFLKMPSSMPHLDASPRHEKDGVQDEAVA